LKDGILNLYVFTNKIFLGMIKAFFYIIWFQEPPAHVFYLDNSYFRIVLSRWPKDCQIDGDRVNLSKNIEIEVLPQVLEIVLPKQKTKRKR